MIEFDPILDAPTTAGYHREAIEQITQCVEERVYCALLGPRLCGKTLLLRFVEQNLAHLLGWSSIYIDLHKIRATTQQVFFADLIRLTADKAAGFGKHKPDLPDENQSSSAGFRAFLSEVLGNLDNDLLLIFDPLEALPTDLVQALLTSLRAAYMDQQMEANQLTVVVSGALSLATMTVGESSPFRGIARRVFIGDLSESDSETLILDFLRQDGINATSPAIRKLVAATSGDVYLMRKISQHCSERVGANRSNRLRSRDVDLVINRFLRDEVFQYAPLLEAIRLIEEDPDLLHGILQLLAEESVPRSSLPLPLSPDLDPLYLTGVVEKTEFDHYRLQNYIYRQFLHQHFSPDRVGRVLAMAGRWESAIDYLETTIQQGGQDFHADLLPATINSMYASQDLPQATRFLRRGLLAAFGISDSKIWIRFPQSDVLRLVGAPERSQGINNRTEVEIPVSADRLEARAFRTQVTIRGQEGRGLVQRAVPLFVSGSQPIGVITISDQLADLNQEGLRERDLQISGFLNQATRALNAVKLRRQELTLAGRVQASLIPEAPPQIPGWQIAATWKPARETSGDFYDFFTLPNSRIGIVIADVVDKGMGAALLMALTRTLIRTYANQFPHHPEQLLQITNQRILTDIDAGMFVTLFYGVLDPPTGLLTYSNAGHPPPYLFSPDGHPGTISLTGSGMPLGVSEEANWQQGIQEIPQGSMLLLYTDGVLDAQNPFGEFLGEEGMLNIIQTRVGQSAVSIQDTLLATLGDFAGAEPQVDDITLMTLIRERSSD
jgi:serine phosphatase RsbU (regulator of sigma subunit)